MSEGSKGNSPHRICVLTEMYFPEETSTGYLLTRTAEGLAKEFSVKVITGPATSLHERLPSPGHEIRNQVEIFRCRGTNFPRNSLALRSLNLVTRTATIWFKALRECRSGDAILVVTNPPLLPFAAALIGALKRCGVVMLIHDVYPEVLVASNLVKPSAMVVKLGAYLNRTLYGRSRRIITLGRDMTRLVGTKLQGRYRGQVRCIPNWAENEIVRPVDRAENSLLNQLGLQDRFVVLYAGNLGRTHGIEYLAAAAKQLAGSNIHFVVLGSGAKKEWLRALVEDQALSNVTILEPRPRGDQIIFLNACDAALISFMPGMAGVSVPSRMYNQMAAGKPIIAVADEGSELALVVREEKTGWVVRPGDIAGLVATIRTAASDPETCREMGARASGVARDKYDFAQADASYRLLFRELFAEVS